jgi:hypothetical protein
MICEKNTGFDERGLKSEKRTFSLLVVNGVRGAYRRAGGSCALSQSFARELART